MRSGDRLKLYSQSYSYGSSDFIPDRTSSHCVQISPTLPLMLQQFPVNTAGVGPLIPHFLNSWQGAQHNLVWRGGRGERILSVMAPGLQAIWAPCRPISLVIWVPQGGRVTSSLGPLVISPPPPKVLKYGMSGARCSLVTSFTDILFLDSSTVHA